ncbi:MAG: ABC transporter ATP-binding protein [Mariprofundus sp.]|nr:ABC transporter ATP-binding protein [Mariprofundus sp.]
MKSELAVSVSNLSKVYKLYNSHADRVKEALNPFSKGLHDSFYALNEISFELKKGETLGVLGKNGSGKSTLLQILTGVLQATSGNVQVNGKVSALLELGAGFNPDFTGIQNVYMNGSIMGYSQAEMDERLDEILAFADIGVFIDQPVKTYSSGMYVRLAFSCAIHIDPEILIVDEALAVGDSRFQLKCIAKMKAFQEAGKTILLVTHDIETIKRFATKALVLDSGRLVFQGGPVEAAIEYYKLLFSDDVALEEGGDGEEGATEKTLVDKLVGDSYVFQMLPLEISASENNVYGNGGVTVQNVEVHGLNFPNLFKGGETIVIKVLYNLDAKKIYALVHEHGLEEKLFFGIRVENKKAVVITDIATPVGLEYKGQKRCSIEFKVKLPLLNAGEYFLSPGIALGTEGHLVVLSEYVYLIQLNCSPQEKVMGLMQWEHEIIDDLN